MKRTGSSKVAVTDEMPEVDIKRTKVIGVEMYFRRVAAESRYVQLDPDVFKDFKTAQEVNDALRMIQQIRKLDHSRARRKMG